MTIAALLIALIATPNLDDVRSPTLLDFQATWCGPCKQMRPAIQQLIDNGYPVKEVDFDESRDLASRYRVEAVPTYIVIDVDGRELARTEGVMPVRELADFYLRAKAKARPRSDDGADRAIEEVREDPREGAAADQEKPAQAAAANPEPWRTVVRVKVKGNGTIGFGSGTIIHSTAEESIILTCAHVFKLEGRGQIHPSRFPKGLIDIDLFDGVLHGKNNQVYYVETVKGEAIDYDFDRDVGLIRIRPGRRLPASRVVPPNWSPKPRMRMHTVGCSEGHDATAWTTTVIKPGVKLFKNSVYEAIECEFAPKQGRSGGGLYTNEGYLAGVCDFAEPQGDRGFYATPQSIYNILDRNRLMALYQPGSKLGGALLADKRPGPGPRRSGPPSIARAQSPDSEESNKVMMPPPELLGIEAPRVAQNQNQSHAKPQSRNATPTPGRSRASTGRGWRSVPGEARVAVNQEQESGATKSTELMIAPEANNDVFDIPAKPAREFVPESRDSSASQFDGKKWLDVESPSPSSSPAPMLSASGAR